MIYILFTLLFLVSITFFKYIIDTKSTIKTLRFERDLYRSISWKSRVNKNDGQKLNWLYKNIKKQISTLIKDIEDTDFENYDGDIKKEVLNALNNIDSYSNNVEKEDMDALSIYKEEYGELK